MLTSLKHTRLQNSAPRVKSTTPIKAELAEKAESQASIAIIDAFDNGGNHGEFVESLITEAGFRDQEIQRYADFIEVPEELLSSKSEGFGKRLEALIAETPSRILDKASANLKDILERGQAKVVNLSLGDSKIDTMAKILGQVNQNKYYGHSLSRHFDLGYHDEMGRIKALAKTVDEVAAESPRLRNAQAQFESLVETAKAQDVHVVVAAGNRGHMKEFYDKHEIPVADDFFASYLAVDSALVVGASNSSGEKARFTPGDSGVDLAAPGTMVVGRPKGRFDMRSGTSFAAPQVTGVLAQIHQENPELGYEEREKKLMGLLTPAPGQEAYLGAGVLLKAKSAD